MYCQQGYAHEKMSPFHLFHVLIYVIMMDTALHTTIESHCQKEGFFYGEYVGTADTRSVTDGRY